MPLAGALSLVVLACWGCVLVTRGRVRRVVAVLGCSAPLGVLVAVVVGWSAAARPLRGRGRDVGGDVGGRGSTGWYWAAAIAAVALASLATALAVRWCGSWPEMGSRYDAPGAAADDADPPTGGPLEPRSVEGHGRGSRPHRRELAE